MAIRIRNVDVIDDSRNLVNIGSTIDSTVPTVALLNTNTSVSAFAAATSLTMGSVAGSTAVVNIGTGVTGSGATKTVNLGTGSGAGSTTNINIGSNVAGTTAILSPLVSAAAMNLTGEIQATGGYGGGSTLSVSADGTIQIAGSTGAIYGSFLISAFGLDREQFMVVNVNAQPFGTNYISVVANHAYQDIPLLTNLRVSTNEGNSSRYFLVDVGNRNGAGAIINLRVTAIGPQHRLNLLAVPTSVIGSTTVTSFYTGFTGNILINTQTDDRATKLQVAGNVSASMLSLSDNLVFSANRKRIVGNLSDSVPAERLVFQSSVANGFSDIGVAPNGSSQIAALSAWNNSSITDASYGQIKINATGVDLISGRIGTGAFLPIRLVTSSIPRLTIDAAGAATFTGNVAVNGGTLSTTAGNAFLFNTDATSLNMAGVASSITIGGVSSTSTANFATGATVSGASKTVNIGRNGLSGSTTNVNIGSILSSGTVAIAQNTTIDGSLNATSTITGSRLNVGSVTSTPDVAVTSDQAFHSGWTRLTNNIVMAWGISPSVGTETSIDVTFPVTFSTVYTVIPSMYNSNGGNNDDAFARVVNFTTSGATFRSERTTNSIFGARYINYIVIGIIG